MTSEVIDGRSFRFVGELGERYSRERWLRAYRRVAALAYFAALAPWAAMRDPARSVDAHAYWLAGSAISYTSAPGGGDAYLYSPAFAQALAPFAALAWPAFAALWTLVLGAALFALAREWSPLLLLWPVLASDIAIGNVHLLLACVVAFGLRRPGVWAFALLTKPTLGVCLLWFIWRREWRKLGEVLGVTALVVAVSLLLAPTAWVDWIGLLARSAGGGVPASWVTILPWPVSIRLALAAGVALLAAWRGWSVLLPVAALLALPVMWVTGLSILVACLPLVAREALEHPFYTGGHGARYSHHQYPPLRGPRR